MQTTPRNLTKAEIREYFRFAKTDSAVADFHQDQVYLIGELLMEIEFWKPIRSKIQADLEAGVPFWAMFFSIWAVAFQMGRECESRLAPKKQMPAKEDKAGRS